MSEFTSPLPTVEKSDRADSLHRSILRARRAARLVGMFGVSQGTGILLERLTDPNATKTHVVRNEKLQHPFRLTAAHSDIAMFGEIVGKGTYDLPGLDGRIDGRLVIDLGANIGISAALFASRYPHSRILAVEPHPRNFGLLAENATAYDGRIMTVEKAVVLEPGVVGSSNPEVGDTGRHAVYEFRTGNDSGEITAEVLTPEELIEMAAALRQPGERVGLLKINIEGEEKALLASHRMDPLLRQTNVAIIEAHERKIAGTADVLMAAVQRTGLQHFDTRGSFFFFQGSE